MGKSMDENHDDSAKVLYIKSRVEIKYINDTNEIIL